MRREGKKSDSAVKRQKFDKLVVQTIGLDAHKNGPKKLQLTISLTEEK